MKTVKIAQLRDQLSRYLDHVKSGGRVIILDRDKPVAEIVPIGTTGTSESEPGRLKALEREGIVKRGSGKLSGDLLTGPLPGKDAGVLDGLLEERRKGR